MSIYNYASFVSFVAVLLSFPCAFQHCLNCSIWPGQLPSAIANHRRSTIITHLVFAKPPILLLVVAVR